MNNTSFNPNWTSIPGNTIRNVLSEKQISVSALAGKMGNSVDFLTQLINGKEVITNEIAVSLSTHLGASTDFWLKREEQYRSRINEINQDQSDKWLKELPISDMVKFGWITNNTNKIQECLNFFDMPDISAWRRHYASVFNNVSFRASTAFNIDQVATITWLRRGEIMARAMNCSDWDEVKFEEALSVIRPLTRQKSPKEFLPLLTKICSNCGVAVVIAPTPKGCRASGATLFLNDKKALLLLSFRYLSDDHFWFTFFHEAGHLILHKSPTPIIEVEVNSDLSIEENEANLFAAEALIPYEIQSDLYRIKGKRNIIQFAQKAGVSPGIVVGQMQHRGIINHKYLNEYKRWFKWEDIDSITNF